ncbi:MAG: D-aminoacyl-tRNA deacylase [Clostridia bacterium]
MKAVIQRVKMAKLYVSDNLVSQIGAGLVVYLGVEKNDSMQNAEYFAKKIAHMRIFEDENGKMNRSVIDIGGAILIVSQFTLLANCARGNRPDFTAAETPDKANALYQSTNSLLAGYGIDVKSGIFGAHMIIEQENDGPVTIIL